MTIMTANQTALATKNNTLSLNLTTLALAAYMAAVQEQAVSPVLVASTISTRVVNASTISATEQTAPTFSTPVVAAPSINTWTLH